MANIKSAIKRAKTNEKRRMRNKAVKTNIKTETKKFYAAVEAGDKEAAKAQLSVAVKKLDRAASKNVIHKNSAARKKHTLQIAYNQMAE